MEYIHPHLPSPAITTKEVTALSLPLEIEDERRARLLDAMPAIAWSASAQTFHFTYVSPGAEKLLGYPAERWTDEPHFWTEHIHPEDQHVAMICHSETLACRDHELVYRMVAADGREVWLRDYINVHVVDGEPVELFGVMVDITRERNAEAASKENRENFRRMVELSPDCIGVHVDESYVYVNQAFVQLLGAQSESEIIGRSLLSFVDPAYLEIVRERNRRISAGESVPYVRVKYRRIDGSLIDVEVAALPLRYGNRDAVQVIARDITDRVRAEQELREAEHMRATAEAKFRWIVEQSVVAVYMISGGKLSYINDTGLKMLGCTLDEVMSQDLALLLLEDYGFPPLFDAGPSVTPIRRKDGSLLHLAFYQNEVTLDGDTVIIGTAVDITESVRARQALEVSEQRYRELVENVTDILFTLDRDGRFVSLSGSFERSTGYPVKDWIGRRFADLVLPASMERATDHFEQALGGNAGIIREYDIADRSGAMVTIEVSSQPHHIDGVLVGTIGMARDVTAQRTITRKLEEVKRMSSLGQVAASLAHEFNNVLMGIQPFVEVIAANAPATRRISEAVSHITRAIGRGKRASLEILRYANPKKPQLYSIDLRAWMPTLLGQLVAALPSSIAMSSSMEPGTSFIRGDREQLEQVITNLVFNARDAIDGIGTIQISVSPAGPQPGGANTELVRISVSDDGPGLAPHVLERIFEPLFTTKRNGTGLGLAIARRLMEAQGGTITAENRAEGGSVFHLLVPVGDAASPASRPFSYTNPGIKRVLLVEDDVSVGAGLEQLLNSAGYDTTWVQSAGDAREAATRTRPQVAVIDVNLPDGNGAELASHLRTEHHDLSVVLSTGHVELNLTNQTKGILSLTKPYELADLLAAIGNVTASVH